jgi:hypothetical protein
MSADKQRSLARRVEILITCQGGPVLEDKLPPRDAARLWRDGHIRKIRVVATKRTFTSFEITEAGRAFLTNHAPLVKTVSAEQAKRDLNRIPAYTKFDRLISRSSRANARGKDRDDRANIARRSAQTAAVISAALREAEAAPFVLVTDWITEQEASEHFIGRMLIRMHESRPETDFTKIDAFVGRSSALRKHFDGLEKPDMNVLGIRALGGGAVLAQVESDPQIEGHPIHTKIYQEWKKARKGDPTLLEPSYPVIPVRHKLVMLSTGDAMNTYVQMLCR